MPRMFPTRLLVLSLLVSLAAGTIAGCKAISRMLPATTVDAPAEGTPEYMVFKAIEAAQVADTNEGYKKMKPLLHSEVTDSAGAESSYRTLNFEAFHRKVHLFTPDDSKPAYKKDYEDDSEAPDRILRIFVVNEGSDMPTPCRLKRDPKVNNEWRITTQCLN